MTDIITLLTLPETSKAFTTVRATARDNSNEGSASPPRKTARLDEDADCGHSSRSRTLEKARETVNAAERGVPPRIYISGQPAKQLTEDLTGTKPFFTVRSSVRVLLSKNTPETLSATYAKIYSDCRSIVCVADQGEGLYESLRLELEQCVGRAAKTLVIEEKTGVSWIPIFNDMCQWFEKQVTLIQSLLIYLDTIYVPKYAKADIRKLAYGLYASNVLQRPAVIERLRGGIDEWVTWEREEKEAHKLRPSINALIAHLFTHAHYEHLFESFYLNRLRNYYLNESAVKYAALVNDASEFLNHCTERIQEEDARSRSILPLSSWTAVQTFTETALLNDRLQWLAKEAISRLMETRDLTRLGQLYSMFSRVDGLKVLCAEFKTYILVMVQRVVKNVEHDDDMVQRLLDFKAFSDSTLAGAFADAPVLPPTTASSSSAATVAKITNQDFKHALTDAFTKGFKARRAKPAELIAKYLDKLMRTGQRGASDAAFNAMLDGALGLYRFTDDKDVFRTFYHRALAKRLLLEKSASDDFERAMLKKLKEEYDPEFSMGDHMFNDLALSRETMREYHERLDESSAAHKLHVMVLQQSFWPFAPRKHDVDLPPTMQFELTDYSAFYRQKHKGHKLEWAHWLGTATLRARFNAGIKELSVSLYQAIVLLLFNASDVHELAFRYILEATRMEDGELRRTLQSLACGNKKVLKKLPPGRDVDDGDVFVFNADFTDLRTKVHINSIQVKETAEETKRTQNAIEGDRKHYLDAAIVRIMKARKELTYEQLKVAAIDAVKGHFVPDVGSIKERIHSLVEQEYLRRDDDDMNLYVYVA